MDNLVELETGISKTWACSQLPQLKRRLKYLCFDKTLMQMAMFLIFQFQI
jgi:hypothetical protein